MKEHSAAVFGGCFGSALFGIFGSAVMARVLMLSKGMRLTALSRQVTTPLAMPIATKLGADVSIAVALAVTTGLVGSNVGASLLTKLGVVSPVTRGLAMGSTAHGLGTAALAATEPEAFAFSALAMVLVGAISSIAIGFAPVRALAMALAGM